MPGWSITARHPVDRQSRDYCNQFYGGRPEQRVGSSMLTKYTDVHILFCGYVELTRRSMGHIQELRSVTVNPQKMQKQLPWE